MRDGLGGVYGRLAVGLLLAACSKSAAPGADAGPSTVPEVQPGWDAARTVSNPSVIGDSAPAAVVAPSDATVGEGGSAVQGGRPGVRFVGRVDDSDPQGARFAWSGSGVVARFSGTSVGVRLGGGQQYSVVLDGVARPKLTPAASGTTAIAQGLDPGPHVLELYRRTEADLGESQWLGFDLSDGQLLAPPPAEERRLEFIGDSISCGYGDEGPNMSCSFTPDTENHYLAYPAIVARDLHAEAVTIAWSGKGVVCNYGDDPASCTNPLPSYYDRTLPQRTTSQWNFAKFQPHAVVINLGTNDFSTAQDPTEMQFEAAYQSFLQHIRSQYHDAYILCTNGPMLGGDDLVKVRAYIDAVVKAMNEAGDLKIKSFALTPQNSADGFGCDYHPNLTTHEKLAMQISAQLKTTLNW